MKLNDSQGVTFPAGFKAAGMFCGIKRSGKKDLALIVSDVPAAGAGVFTTNVCCAAPVQISRRHVNAEFIRAVVINSGNANAATGEQGLRDAIVCTEEVAYRLSCEPTEILVASTGIIGSPLKTERIVSSLDALIADLSAEHGADAAEAILTTDTFSKQCACEVALSGGTVRIGGIAKGSGMIMPNMATMLGCITTDAAIDKHLLQRLLARAVAVSFNRITVDGDTSTNDCVLMMANGNSGVALTEADLYLYQEALDAVCVSLAKMIIRDGEGATKFVSVRVEGCRTEAEAETIARTIANSPLVKTALYGENPNWGRILAAAGRSGVEYDQNKVDVLLNGVPAVRGGCSAGTDKKELATALQDRDILIRVLLEEGTESAEVWTCDLTHRYIDINVEYS